MFLFLKGWTFWGSEMRVEMGVWGMSWTFEGKEGGGRVCGVKRVLV